MWSRSVRNVRVVDGDVVGEGVVLLVVLGLVHPPSSPLQPRRLGQAQDVVQQAAAVHLCKWEIVWTEQIFGKSSYGPKLF